MMNRRLTTKPAKKMSQMGEPAAIRGSELSWAEPAKTSKVMARAAFSVSPDLTMATPVTIPQVKVASRIGNTARKPSRIAANLR